MFDDDYADYFPPPWSRVQTPTLDGWAAGIQQYLDTTDEDLEYIISSYQVDRAQGRDLNETATRYGTLGKRRGRGDSAFQQWLTAIVGAYAGRGTTYDIQVAVAGGILAEAGDPGDPADGDIDVQQDYTANEYSLTIHEWVSHDLDMIARLAELADASGVQRADPITYVFDELYIGPEVGESTTPDLSIDVAEGDLGPEFFESDAYIVDSDGYGAGEVQ